MSSFEKWNEYVTNKLEEIEEKRQHERNEIQQEKRGIL
mgnify:CR=1 FL=1